MLKTVDAETRRHAERIAARSDVLNLYNTQSKSWSGGTMTRMTIFSGWREQYDRMLRSHDHLIAVASGRELASSDEARDELLHFFEDAYHLKDWLASDGQVPIDRRTVEDHVSGAAALQLCADLCNGAKHFQLDPGRRARTGDVTTAFTSQSVTVRPATAGSGEPPRPALHWWTVESNGQFYDAVRLAGDVVTDWQGWLRAKGLL